MDRHTHRQVDTGYINRQMDRQTDTVAYINRQIDADRQTELSRTELSELSNPIYI